MDETYKLISEKIFELHYALKSPTLYSVEESIKLAFHNALREKQPSESVPAPINVLYIGLEDSFWVAEQTIQDKGKPFRDTTRIAMDSETVNKLLLSLKEQANRTDFQIRLPGGMITNQTMIVAFSQSGVTFPTWHSVNRLKKKRQEDERRMKLTEELMTELHRRGTNRIYAVMGEIDTPLGRAVGQKLTPNALFCGKIFLTGSGLQESEARSLSAMTMHALGTEMIVHLMEVIRGLFPGVDPLGMRLEQGDIRELKEIRDQTQKELVPIIGADANAEPVQSETHEKLNDVGNTIGLDILDAWVGRTVLVLYIVATVAFGLILPLGMGILQLAPSVGMWGLSTLPGMLPGWPLFMHLFQGMAHSGSVPWAIPAAHGFDALFYIFISPITIYAARLLTGRMIMARLGARKLIIADIPHVANPVAMFITKLFALSYGSAAIFVKSRKSPGRFDSAHCP